MSQPSRSPTRIKDDRSNKSPDTSPTKTKEEEEEADIDPGPALPRGRRTFPGGKPTNTVVKGGGTKKRNEDGEEDGQSFSKD
jgi:hypothetical protein